MDGNSLKRKPETKQPDRSTIRGNSLTDIVLAAGQIGDAFGCKPQFNCVKNNFSCNGGKDGEHAAKNKGFKRSSQRETAPKVYLHSPPNQCLVFGSS